MIFIVWQQGLRKAIHQTRLTARLLPFLGHITPNLACLGCVIICVHGKNSSNFLSEVLSPICLHQNIISAWSTILQLSFSSCFPQQFKGQESQKVDAIFATLQFNGDNHCHNWQQAFMSTHRSSPTTVSPEQFFINPSWVHPHDNAFSLNLFIWSATAYAPVPSPLGGFLSQMPCNNPCQPMEAFHFHLDNPPLVVETLAI